MELLPLLFLASILATCHASSHGGLPLPIHLLRPQTGSGGFHGVSCSSWRLAVETNNIRDWKTIPASCEDYVGHYMLGDMYRGDSKIAADAALAHARSLNLTGNEVWVFDVDETTLSNLPYYAQHGFGAEPYNWKVYNEWVLESKAPALPESLRLYNKLVNLGIKIVFLTGRREHKRNATATNLKNAGYYTWEKLILRGNDKKPTIAYKSGERTKIELQGYTIIGNSGDQWSDILGPSPGKRTFKLPDPMYYIG